MNRNLASCAVLCWGVVLSSAASAHHDHPFTFTYLEAVYSKFNRSVSEGDGYTLEGSLHLPNGILLGAAYDRTEFDEAFDRDVDNLDSNAYRVNVGYARHLTQDTAGWVRLHYAEAELDSDEPDVDGIEEEVQILEAGLRQWVFYAGIFEVHASGAYMRVETEGVDETGPQAKAGFRVHVIPKYFSLGFSATRNFIDEDTDVLSIDARLKF